MWNEWFTKMGNSNIWDTRDLGNTSIRRDIKSRDITHNRDHTDINKGEQVVPGCSLDVRDQTFPGTEMIPCCWLSKTLGP
jgi:hypothetical protein